jgi:hypothetical protein
VYENVCIHLYLYTFIYTYTYLHTYIYIYSCMLQILDLWVYGEMGWVLYEYVYKNAYSTG